LSNKVPVALPSGGNNVQVGTEPTSIADIDVIRSDVRTNTLKDLLQIIEECHTYEKELYFGMMKQEFLTTLKPIY